MSENEFLTEEEEEERESTIKLGRSLYKAALADLDSEENPYSNPYAPSLKPSRSKSQSIKQAEAQEDESHYKTIQAIEIRGKKVMEQVREARKVLEKKDQEIQGRVEEQIKQRKEKARATIVEFELENDRLTEQEKIKKMYEDQLNNLQKRVQSVTKEKDEAILKQVEEREKGEVSRQEIDTLKNVNSLLRTKMKKMNSIQLETERKLQVYLRLDPLFKSLSEKYDFGPEPEEILAHLERIERSNIESYEALLQTQEDKGNAERKLIETKSALEDEYQKAAGNYATSTQKLEKKLSELTQMYHEVENDLINARKTCEKYAELSFAVTDLWNKWKESELTQNYPAFTYEIGSVELSQPTQIVAAVDQLFQFHAPTKASEGIRELSALAYRLWLRYYENDVSLKSNAMRVFTKLHEDYERLHHNVARLKLQMAQEKNRYKAAQDQIRQLKREINVFKTKEEAATMHRASSATSTPKRSATAMSSRKRTQPKEAKQIPPSRPATSLGFVEKRQNMIEDMQLSPSLDPRQSKSWNKMSEREQYESLAAARGMAEMEKRLQTPLMPRVSPRKLENIIPSVAPVITEQDVDENIPHSSPVPTSVSPRRTDDKVGVEIKDDNKVIGAETSWNYVSGALHRTISMTAMQHEIYPPGVSVESAKLRMIQKARRIKETMKKRRDSEDRSPSRPQKTPHGRQIFGVKGKPVKAVHNDGEKKEEVPKSSETSTEHPMPAFSSNTHKSSKRSKYQPKHYSQNHSQRNNFRPQSALGIRGEGGSWKQG